MNLRINIISNVSKLVHWSNFDSCPRPTRCWREYYWAGFHLIRGWSMINVWAYVACQVSWDVFFWEYVNSFWFFLQMKKNASQLVVWFCDTSIDLKCTLMPSVWLSSCHRTSCVVIEVTNNASIQTSSYCCYGISWKELGVYYLVWSLESSLNSIHGCIQFCIYIVTTPVTTILKWCCGW